MIVATEQAKSYLLRLAQDYPERGLRFYGVGNRCQGISVKAKLRTHCELDDRQENLDGLAIWISADLLKQVVSIQLDMEFAANEPALVIKPKLAECACSSTDCNWRQMDTAINQ